MLKNREMDMDSYEYFLERLSWNDEINFFYKGKEYWMVPSGNGWLFYESGPIDEQYYDSWQEMLEKICLDGKTIKELWPKIDG